MTGCIVVVQKYTQIDRIFRVATLVDANNWDAQLIKNITAKEQQLDG